MALKLGVNIDHVTTLRQARYRGQLDNINAEPDILEALQAAERGGADGITIHLREDRRHIQDVDVFAIREKTSRKLNLEMGNAPEILQIALDAAPDEVCLVPENRREVTTEGGLDVVAGAGSLETTIARLHGSGIRVSLFIDPERDQIEQSAKLGADMVELHTGTFANARGSGKQGELVRLSEAAELAHSLGLQINAGHGINTNNVRDLFVVPHLVELNIGHHLVSRAIFVGLVAAVREMKAQLVDYNL